MTYGQIRYRVSKEAPGVDLDLIDGYLLDRYTSILDRLKWQRQDAEVVLVTVAPYVTGTVAVTQGASAVTLTGGALTAAMTGRSIRIADDDEWYEFTYASAGVGALDRAYTGSTAAAATYSIYQNIFPLPADCRILNSIDSADSGPLERLSKAQMNESAAGRHATGRPQIFAPYMDDGSTAPQMQIELYPIPDDVYTFVVSHTAEAPAITGSGTTMLPWVRPSALAAGATADALDHLGNFNAADRWERKYQTYVDDMVRTEKLNRGATPIRLSHWLTRHNVLRAIRSSTNRTGPRLP